MQPEILANLFGNTSTELTVIPREERRSPEPVPIPRNLLYYNHPENYGNNYNNIGAYYNPYGRRDMMINHPLVITTPASASRTVVISRPLPEGSHRYRETVVPTFEEPEEEEEEVGEPARVIPIAESIVTPVPNVPESESDSDSDLSVIPMKDYLMSPKKRNSANDSDYVRKVAGKSSSAKAFLEGCIRNWSFPDLSDKERRVLQKSLLARVGVQWKVQEQHKAYSDAHAFVELEEEEVPVKERTRSSIKRVKRENK